VLKVWEPFEALMRPFTVAHPEMELPFTKVEEKEGEFLLAAEVPGFAPEEVKVTMKDNVLEIAGKHEEKKEEEGRSYRRFNEFRRSFRLPRTVNTETIEAKMVDGLLTVVLPKTDEPEVKTISVNVAEPKLAEPKLGEPKHIGKEKKVAKAKEQAA
jgi:HSP20 family protein